jgi:hypothetical protein
MKYLQGFVQSSGITETVAYHDAHWTRRNAPLLDSMGAVIDHVKAHSRGGRDEADNFATACNKCNAHKSNIPLREFTEKSPRHPIKGKYGEPQDWDGLSTLFVILVERTPTTASATDLDWLKHLKRATGAAAQI